MHCAWGCIRFLVILASGVSFANLPQTVASKIRGIAPEEEPLYIGDEFTCFDGGAELPRGAVNDNYCDCADGSDEPGTSACAGLGSNPKRIGFYCPNALAAPQYIFASKVGDGICDCCDGSDEWQEDGCRDVCEELGRAQRERLQQRAAAAQKGIEKRRAKLAEIQGQAETMKAKLAELQQSLPALEAEVQSRNAKLVLAEDHARQKRAELSKDGDPAAAQVHDNAAEEGAKISEYAKWMEKANTDADSASSATASKTQEVPAGISVIDVERKQVREVTVKSGDMVDFIEFLYADGKNMLTGGGAGNVQEPFELEAGEGIIEVRGTQGGLLDSVQFITTQGRESNVYGGKGGDRFSIKAGEGKVIVGLGRKSTTASKIDSIHQCDFIDRRTPEEKLRDEASLSYREAKDGLEVRRREIQDIEAKLQSDFTNGLAAYRLFSDQCGEGHFDKYNYKICVFGEAKQGHVKLGQWVRWEDERRHIGWYDRGERCAGGSGKTRSLRVRFECGDELRIESLREPAQCEYEASMTHPAACDPGLLGLEGATPAGVRVRQPHESVHDEL